jgi:hypothetical protein
MLVLTCATAVEKTMPLYLKQLDAAGIKYIWGSPPEKIGHEVGSWRGKLLWQRGELAKLHPAEKVILSDGWDVVFQGTLDEVEWKFPPAGEILLSGEKNCWPDWNAQRLYPMGTSPWMFVNSGGIAGRAGVLLEEIERGLAEGLPEMVQDDQRFWTWLFLTGKWKLKIDYECRLFQTFLLQIIGSDLGVEGDTQRLVNLRSGSHPNFLHWNGGETWPEKTLKLLGMEEKAA